MKISKTMTTIGDDPLAILGISIDCTDEEVRKAYFTAVRQHPPDRDREGFARVRAAYEALQSEEQRIQWRLGWRDQATGNPRLVLDALGNIRSAVGPAPWLALIKAASACPSASVPSGSTQG
ncbi:MAG: J domain-containing protein [Candidatus Ozemobacteraceae bacterium]